MTASREQIIGKLQTALSDAGTTGMLVYLRANEIEQIIAALLLADAAERQESALWWVLWHHQGGSSPIGQTLRKFLGIGQYAALNLKQLDAAKSFALSFTDAAKLSGAADEG
jgi:hypothetical protein